MTASSPIPVVRSPARTDPPSVLALDAASIAAREGMNQVTPGLARVASEVTGRRSWQVFGYSRGDDYARERLDRSGRWLRDLALLGKAFAGSPELLWALVGEDGGKPIGRVAATMIARVATPESMAQWIESARRMTVVELRAKAVESNRRSEGSGDTDIESYQRVRLPVPSALHAGFGETAELARAVSGTQMSVTGFVECLVAESCSSWRRTSWRRTSWRRTSRRRVLRIRGRSPQVRRRAGSGTGDPGLA